jgi:hypothetical protein
MANRFPLVLDVDSGNKIKELPSGDNLNLRESSIVNVQDISALGTINAADITVNGERLVAQQFADLTDTPSTFAGSETYFVKVNEAGTGLEFRPFSDIGDIEVDTITVVDSVLPATPNTAIIGDDGNRFTRVTANELKGNLIAFDGAMVFDANSGKITYAALEGAPTSLSEFVDDVGYLKTVDLDNTLAGLFDEGQEFVTDIRGSVFADDSTILVDAVSGKIVGDINYETTGNITGSTINIQATDNLNIADVQLIGNVTPDVAGTRSIGTSDSRIGEGYFNTVNADTLDTEGVGAGGGVGTGSISSSTDIEITAGNRVKILGGVPFKIASITDANLAAVAGQNGDLLYNTTTGKFIMYQDGAWLDVNGNVEAATGTSNFNDVVVSGNLTVSGTTTTVDTTNTTISDNVITLNEGETLAGVSGGSGQSGIEIDRGTEASVSLVWDEGEGKWTVGSETFVAGTIEAVGLNSSFLGNGGENSPLLITSGLQGQTGNTIFINPQGSDTLVQMWGETVNLVTGPYNTYDSPYMQFKTEGAFKAHQGAYFDGNLTGDVVGSVFGDDSTTLVDAVNNAITAQTINTAAVSGDNFSFNNGTIQSNLRVGGNIWPYASGVANLGTSSESYAVVYTATLTGNSTGNITGYSNLTGASGGAISGFTNITGDSGGAISGFTNITGDSGGAISGFTNLTGDSGGTISQFTDITGDSGGTISQFTDITGDSGGTISQFTDITGDSGGTISQFTNITGDSGGTISQFTNITGDGGGTISGFTTLTGDGGGSISGFNMAWSALTGTPTTLAGYGITDAATSAQGTNADTAFGWGDHSTEGYLTEIPGAIATDVTGSLFADDSSTMVDAVNNAMFSDTLTLNVLTAEPSNPANGMMAVADGTIWDPTTSGVQTLVVYLGGAWRQIQTA